MVGGGDCDGVSYLWQEVGVSVSVQGGLGWWRW
jgi:hypothetical protein